MNRNAYGAPGTGLLNDCNNRSDSDLRSVPARLIVNSRISLMRLGFDQLAVKYRLPLHTFHWRHGDKPRRAFTDKDLRVSMGQWRRLETWRHVLPDCCVGWDNFGVDDVSGLPAGASGKVTLCLHQGHFLRKETRTATTLAGCCRK